MGKLHSGGRRRMWSAVWLSGFWLASAATANTYFHYVDHSYTFGNGLVEHPFSQSDTLRATSSGSIDRRYNQAVSQSGPLDTNMTVGLRGFADFNDRRFGAAAYAFNVANAYDVNNPPANSKFYTVSGRVETGVSDDVRIYSPSVTGGRLINFSIAPGRLDGELAVPRGDGSAGGGTAAVQVKFGLAGFQPNGVRVGEVGNRIDSRSFERFVSTGDTPNPLAINQAVKPDVGPSGVLAGNFSVFNGETYTFDLTIALALQTIASAFPATGPTLVESFARFDSTYYFNGFIDFTDENGNRLNDVTFASVAGSGFDWLSPASITGATVVPLQGAAGLFALGLPLLLAVARGSRRSS